MPENRKENESVRRRFPCMEHQPRRTWLCAFKRQKPDSHQTPLFYTSMHKTQFFVPLVSQRQGHNTPKPHYTTHLEILSKEILPIGYN